MGSRSRRVIRDRSDRPRSSYLSLTRRTTKMIEGLLLLIICLAPFFISLDLSLYPSFDYLLRRTSMTSKTPEEDTSPFIDAQHQYRDDGDDDNDVKKKSSAERIRAVVEYAVGRRGPLASKESRPPLTPCPANLILILFDDSGYGDLGANRPNEEVHEGEGPGRKRPSDTPFLDELASRGLRLTSFYVTHSTCSPSRASTLTGRYGVRTGANGHIPPKSSSGLPPSEMTIASFLQSHGFATLLLGKWHLGHQPPHDPISHGFDEFLGIPFSNDMGCTDETEALGYDNPELSDTPTKFFCPPEEHLYFTDGHNPRGALQGLQKDFTPILKPAPRKYRENKWTKMGGGDPTVLPLYHTCASEYYSDIKEQKQGIDVSLSLKENSNDQACKEAVRNTVNTTTFGCSTSGKPRQTFSRRLLPMSRFGEQAIREQPTSLWKLSERLVSRAESFIAQQVRATKGTKEQRNIKDSSSSQTQPAPFFLYFPLIHTHVPHTPAKKFMTAAQKAHKDSHSSVSTEYSGALREADAMVSRLMTALHYDNESNDESSQYFANTLTVVTSDNGPWLRQGSMSGSPWPYRGGKFSLLEGGVRVFCIMHWPALLGRHLHRNKNNHTNAFIPNRDRNGEHLQSVLSLDSRGWASDVVASTLDLFPTFAAAAHTIPPKDREYDGINLLPLLLIAGAARGAVVHSKEVEFATDKVRQMHARILLFQHGHDFAAARFGRYKVSNLLMLKNSDNRKGMRLLGLIGRSPHRNTSMLKELYPSNNIGVFDLYTDPSEAIKLKTENGMEDNFQDAQRSFYVSRWQRPCKASLNSDITVVGKTRNSKEASKESDNGWIPDSKQDIKASKSIVGDEDKCIEEEKDRLHEEISGTYGYEGTVGLTGWEFRAALVRAKEEILKSVEQTYRSKKVDNKVKASSLPCASSPLRTHRNSAILPFRSGAMCHLCKCNTRQVSSEFSSFSNQFLSELWHSTSKRIPAVSSSVQISYRTVLSTLTHTPKLKERKWESTVTQRPNGRASCGV